MKELHFGEWLSIIALVLAVPLGISSNLLTPRLLAYLKKRRLVKESNTRQEAIRRYKLVKSLHNRTRDRYAYYLQQVGWAVIFMVVAAICTIVLVLVNPTFGTSVPDLTIVTLLVLAIFGATISVVLMLVFYEVSRQVDQFEEYQKEFEEKWGKVKD
jgi:hypothetical protein